MGNKREPGPPKRAGRHGSAAPHTSRASHISHGTHMRTASLGSCLHGDDDQPELSVCIIGGGLGGIYTALKLSKWTSSKTRIFLVDPKDRFVFPPLLSELAVGHAEIDEVAPLFAPLLDGSRVQFVRGTVTQVDPSLKRCSIDRFHCSEPLHIDYDFLVIAVGNEPRLDSIPGAAEHCIPFYSLANALTVRDRLREIKRPSGLRSRVTILGGNYGGVELATNMAEELGQQRAHIAVVDRNAQPLPQAPPFNRRAALAAIERLEIHFHHNSTVASVAAEGVHIVNGVGEEQLVGSDLVLFTAGSAPASLLRALPLPKDHHGKLRVRATLQVVGEDCVFALGDCSVVEGQSVPANAQAVFQQADIVARNLYRILRARPDEAEALALVLFSYSSLGDMVSLGENYASIASPGGWPGIRGLLAALGRRVVYAYRMPTFRQFFAALGSGLANRLNRLFSAE